MELTQRNLIGMLSNAVHPADEQVVAIKPLRRSIRFKKDEWNRFFPDWAGIKLKVEDTVQVMPAEDGGPVVEIDDSVRECLKLSKENLIGVTVRDGKFSLKRMEFVELPKAMPGFYAFDSFTDRTVVRTYQTDPDLSVLKADSLDDLLNSVGKLRYDPMAPFQTMPGMLGYLARKEFAGGLSAEDRKWAGGTIDELAAKQAKDGSWQNAVPDTAFNVGRLLDLGCSIEDDSVRKAVDWLLSRPEPVGFPSLYMSSDGFLEKFNDWKKTGGKGRKGRTTPEGDKKQFRENRDVFGVPDSYCEARFTWTNGVALGVLLRCGLEQHERVVRGINTLLNMDSRAGWCGCGYFESRTHIEPADAPNNFAGVQVPDTNRAHAWNWFSGTDEIKGWSLAQGQVIGLDAGNGQSLLVSAVSNSGDCARVVLRGLSYHPEFAGSNLETMFALRCIAHQCPNGAWRGHYLSFMFGMLERCLHPLSTFAILRSLPLLIRKQRKSGLWDESEEGYNTHKCQEPPPSPEQSSFMILKALSTHGLLESVLP